jgi:hypothetical protein
MLWGSVVTGFISYYLNAFYSGRFLDYSIWQQVRDILPSFTVASVMAAAVYALSFVEAAPLVLLASQVLAGVVLVVALCEIFRVEAYREIKIIVMSYINKFRHGR